MSAPAETAFRVADSLRLPPPWEVFGQRVRRFETYFDESRLETVRGPIELEGIGLRIFRPREGKLGIGFQATSDLSPAGIHGIIGTAEQSAKLSLFPATHVELPSHAPRIAQGPEVCSVSLWDRPTEEVARYVHALLTPYEPLHDVAPSFGSVKANLIETSIANSDGLRTSYVATTAELEFAVKAFGGPEGRAPGEYWLTREFSQLDEAPLAEETLRWAQRARDVRVAKAPPSGVRKVGLPPAFLNEVLPGAMSARFSGSGRLQKMTFEEGARIAADGISIRRDPRIGWAFGSSPVDDEGWITEPVPLVERGTAAGLVYDVLHAAAFDRRSNGSAGRTSIFERVNWYRFTARPHPYLGPVSVEVGTDGEEEELIEGIDDGLWIDQLGWPNPDPMSGSFGGEIRIAYRVEHGKITGPVRGGTLGGPVFASPGAPSLLANVRAIGSRAVLTGHLSSPSLVTDGLTIAGSG